MRTRHGDLLAAEVGLEQVYDLLKALQADAGPVPADAHGPVLRLDPARAEPDLQAPAGQEVEGGQLLGQHRRQVIVDAEHPAADPDGIGRRGGNGHGGDGSEILDRVAGLRLQGARPEVVIGEVESGIAELLGLAGEGAPLLSGRRLVRLQAEPEGFCSTHMAPASVPECAGILPPPVGLVNY